MNRTRVCAAAAFCVVTALAQGQTPEASPKPDVVPAGLPHLHPVEHKNIVYRTAPDKDGKPVDQVLDVYEIADGKTHPVIVYWHGGAWWKGQRPAGVGNHTLVDMGFDIVNVDYRMTDVAPAPAAVQDVRCSLAWVAKNAAQYHFDVSKIVAYGTSAGGHLALMAGFLPQKNAVDDPACGSFPKVAAVMDFYGIPDVYDIVASGVPLSKSTVRWVGGAGAGDPASLDMARRMSPATYLSKSVPPVFIAHGDKDPTVPYQQSLTLKKQLEDLNVPVTMYSVPGGGHGGFPPDQTLIINQKLLEFFVSLHIIPPPPQ